MHQGEEVLQLGVEGQELLPLLLAPAGDGLAPDHAGELFGIEFLPLRLEPGRPLGTLRAGEQRADEGDEKQQDEEAQKAQKDPKKRLHAFASSSAERAARRWKRYARPMAMAPLGMIMKLVEPVREGTRMKRRDMMRRGAAAIFRLPR